MMPRTWNDSQWPVLAIIASVLLILGGYLSLLHHPLLWQVIGSVMSTAGVLTVIHGAIQRIRSEKPRSKRILALKAIIVLYIASTLVIFWTSYRSEIREQRRAEMHLLEQQQR